MWATPGSDGTAPVPTEPAVLSAQLAAHAALHPLLDALEVGVCLFRLEQPETASSLRLVFANAAASTLFGTGMRNAVGGLIGDHFPATLTNGVAEGYRQVVADQRARDFGAITSRSAEVTGQRFAVSGYPLGPDTVAVVFDNLTAAAHRIDEFAAIVESASDAILSWNLEGTILSWNAAAEDMYGYTADEAIGQPVTMLLPPDRIDEIAEMIERLKAGERPAAYETTRKRKDGSVVEISLVISPIHSSRGTLSGAATIARDITQRNRDDARLRQLAAIVDASSDPLFSVTPEGVLLTWNHAAETFFGYTAEEMIGGQIMPLFGVPAMPDALVEQHETWQRGIAVKPFELDMVRKDGTTVTVSTWAAPIFDAAGAVTSAAIVVRDLTDQRALEQRLRQAAKMEAIGSLASGVAHDFNNVLSVIRGASDVLRREVGDPAARELLSEIDQAAGHAAALTRQLLAFGRQQLLSPEPTDLNAAVGDTLRLVRSLLSQQIRIDTDLAPDLPLIDVDRNQLEQIVLNLSANAGDAMPGGGTLAIRTGEATLDESYAALHLEVTPGAYVLLEITDSGTGIDEEIREHIFDPFFTTKAAGTGLGLATVYGIVKQSGGHLAAYSEAGHGTTFRIYLPLARSVPPAAPSRASSPAPRGAGQTILLVDDFDGLRKVVSKVLTMAGYTVLAAADGGEALGIARAHAGPIDLLLTDVVMPTMGGRELHDALCAQRPQLRVIFVSGYPSDSVIRHGIQAGSVDFVQKPFTNDELLAKIGAVLGTPAG